MTQKQKKQYNPTAGLESAEQTVANTAGAVIGIGTTLAVGGALLGAVHI